MIKQVYFQQFKIAWVNNVKWFQVLLVSLTIQLNLSHLIKHGYMIKLFSIYNNLIQHELTKLNGSNIAMYH